LHFRPLAGSLPPDDRAIAVTDRRDVASCLLGSLLVASLMLPAAARSQDASPAVLLIERARAEGIAADPQWRALGYWQPDLAGSGATSLLDDPSFFFAANGKTDPEAELVATLTAFAAAPPDDDPERHAQCTRPARWQWLKQRLAIDVGTIPERPCLRFEAWMAAIAPARVSLIFPAAYLNNPSSMFGHTLIRLDPPQRPGAPPLNATTVHFAADHQGESGVLFALKGLTGGYRGYFSMLRYYEKVTQYSDIENRDIWEYDLDIEPERIRLMLASLWEVDMRPIDYYFFSTNCSYVLLALLNVARPDLRLTENFPIYAIPVDTVRAVLDGTGLLRGATFRPSQRTVIGDRWRRLDVDEQALVLELTDGERPASDAAVTALAPERRARVLELAQAYLQYRIETGGIDRAEMAPRALALLRARAEIGPVPPAAPPPQPAVRPDQGHHSARLAGGVGMTGSRPFVELALRPAYHDLLDPAGGYVPGAAIDFLDVHIRWYDSAVPELETATLMAVESLTPRDELFRALSWRARFGFDRWRDRGSQPGDIVFSVAGGAGPSWAVDEDTRVYVLADAALLADRHWPDGRLFAVGPSTGLLWSPTAWWTIRPEGRYMLIVEDGERNGFDLSLQQSFTLARDLSLRFSVAARNDGDETYGEWSTMLSWSF
jgi:hypothetical protein